MPNLQPKPSFHPSPRQPSLRLPHGACDAHCHVFGPAARFPFAADRPFTPADAPKERRVKYYRNPMGLPDTSSVPKKDSMGMDYIAVYDDDDADDGTVKISLGKLQKAGVRSEQVERRVLNTAVRAPGTIELDERRVSIVSFRFEGFIEQVENVTTGQHVHKGQPLMRVYSPALASAAAEYVSVFGAKAGSGFSPSGSVGSGSVPACGPSTKRASSLTKTSRSSESTMKRATCL